MKLEVWREGANRTLEITMGEAKGMAARRPGPPGASPQAQASGRLGIAVSELPPAGRRALGVKYGLVIEGVEGINADAPLQRGDVIVTINQQGFSSLEDFNRRVADVPEGGSVALLVRRGEASV